MTTQRRNRTWVPFTSSVTGPDTLAASAVVAFDLLTVVETELGHDLTEYTTQRLILKMLFVSHVSTDTVLGMGLKYTPEHLAVANQQQPQGHPAADWQWHEYQCLVSEDLPLKLERDIAVSRRMRAVDMDLELLLENGPAAAIQYHISGRLLILRA